MRCSRPAAPSITLLLWAFFCAAAAAAGPAPSPLDELIEYGGYVITRDGTPIAQLNSTTPFIPASTIKIATALTSLKILGPAHRIKTEFYLRNDRILCIKGYGDPFLVSERVRDIGAKLKEKGLDQVETIVLDDGFFALEGPTDGAQDSVNPYDAQNTALTVNFNTVVLVKHDTGMIDSPEPQTPVLDIARAVGALVEPGLHRLNVSAFSHRNSAITSHRLVAELFAEQLRRQGITVEGDYRRGRVKADDRLLYTYRSELTVAEMLKACLKYSNNFIANQLFLYCGAVRYGPPATWEKGREAMADILYSTIGLHNGEVMVVEGSGLSRRNLITPAAMITLLEHFKPYASLLSETKSTPLKSGTMTHVYGYAGYFSSTGRLDPFVILLNQKTNNRDQLLKLGSDYYRRRITSFDSPL